MCCLLKRSSEKAVIRCQQMYLEIYSQNFLRAQRTLLLGGTDIVGMYVILRKDRCTGELAFNSRSDNGIKLLGLTATGSLNPDH
jgi:hypothetical protein